LLRYREVRSRFQLLHRGFADEDNIRDPSERGDNVLDQLIERAAKLILG
jgi:hypothetical protein